MGAYELDSRVVFLLQLQAAGVIETREVRHALKCMGVFDELHIACEES